MNREGPPAGAGKSRRTDVKSSYTRVLFWILSAVIAFAAMASTQVNPASAATSATASAKAKKKSKKKHKLTVKLITTGQNALVGTKTLKARVISAKKGKVAVRAVSSTFDGKDVYRVFTHTKKVKFRKAGQKKVVKLRLTSAGVTGAKACEARSLQARAGSKRSQAKQMLRQSTDCKAEPIDLSRANECDFIGPTQDSQCMLPFPNDYYTLGDANSPTKRRINFQTDAMPANADGVHIDATAYNENDGFSQGQSIIVKVPGLDTPEALAQTGAQGLADPSRYLDANAPIVVIDAATGQRHPIWVELDSTATTPAATALVIHPLVNFDPKAKYIVAMRNLKDSAGNVLKAPAGFRYYRDFLPSNKVEINQRRSQFEIIFKKLRAAAIQRSDLYLAWDFTVASDENNSDRMLSMRDQAFAELGDTNLADLDIPASSTAPSFTVDNVDDNPDAEIARRVEGHFMVPCYMTNNCATGARLNLDADGNPVKTGMYAANFSCIIPHAAVDDVGAEPARAMVYGHGLMGDTGEVSSDPQRKLAQNYDFTVCGTNEIGMSEGDLLTVVIALKNLSTFPSTADRLQQGLLNEMYLSRLMIHPDGFSSSPDFHVNPAQPINASPPVIDTTTERSYYRGNSQGGIMGGAYMALSPDADRGALGVSGMNYSVLLPRSVDWATYSAFMYPAYPVEINRPLALSIVQMLWDRGEPNGYAHRMTDNPLPNTPPHKVLLDEALGDHQVTNWQAMVEARTIGAQAIDPLVYPGRWPGVDYQWNVPSIASYPYDGSAIGIWDSGPVRPDPGNPGEFIGTNVPPLTNLPNDAGEDPHEFPRRAITDQAMVSGFLSVGGKINDTCGVGPCYAGGFTGP